MGDSGGEKLSKNEQKRRAKAAQKAAEKEKKMAEAAAKDKGKEEGGNKINEEEISPNEYFKLRSAAVEELKTDPATHPYPHKFHVDISLQEFIDRCVV